MGIESLRNRIHTSTSGNLAALEVEIDELYLNLTGSYGWHLFNDHLGREMNKRSLVLTGSNYYGTTYPGNRPLSTGESEAPVIPPVYYEDYLLDTFSSGLVAFYPLASGLSDSGPSGITPYASSAITYVGAQTSPSGFMNSGNSVFNGSSSQIRLENTTYPFGLSRFTIMCWFRKTAAGVATITAGASDGFVTADPIVPLVTKGRGEGDGSNVDCNWFLGLNKVSDGSTYRIAADYEDTGGTPNNHKVTGTTLIANGNWYQGAATYDGTNFKVYLNGVEEGSVIPDTGPRSDSIQKAGIGTAYTSASVAAGFFAGSMAGVSIWNHALAPTGISGLYAKGMEVLRIDSFEDGEESTYVLGANDNAIVHGTNFANWTVDSSSSKAAAGITIVQGSEYAYIDVDDLEASTEYWMRVTLDQKSAGMNGYAQLVALDETGNEISGTDGLAVNFNTAGTLGTYYAKVKTKATSAQAGLFRLVIKHGTSANGESFRLSEVTLFPIPERSSAKLAVLGDRTGSYNSSAAALVDAAILSDDADTVNLLQMGDASDTTNPFTINNTVKSGIEAAGGKVYPILGNHDYDGTNETTWLTYWGTSGYNGGKTYYTRELGNCFIAFYDDNPENADNAGGYNATNGTTQQASTMGQWLTTGVAATSKPWKICMIHRPPYSSHSSGGDASNDMDFAGMGFNIVLQGHYHGIERLHKGNTLYYTVARGGNGHHGWGSTHQYSEWKEDDQAVQGYLKIHDGASGMVLEYFDTDNNLIDRVKMTL